MEDYLDLFDLAAHQIQGVLQSEAAKEHGKMNNIVIGKGNNTLEYDSVAPGWQHLQLWHERGIVPHVNGSQH